jgi:hypothetical protein
MSCAGHVARCEKWNPYEALVEKPEGKRTFKKILVIDERIILKWTLK